MVRKNRAFSQKFQADFINYLENNFETTTQFMEFLAAAVTEMYEDSPKEGEKLTSIILGAAAKMEPVEAAML